MSVPIPVGFGLAVDRRTRVRDGSTLLGGTPTRVLKLSGRGAEAWAELSAGSVRSREGGLLARRVTDAGLAHPVPPPTLATDVTVVVPVLDRPGELERCLRALGRQHAVVVVDDGSSGAAGVAAVARRHGATLVRRAANGGPAAARNSGLAAVTTEFVAFVDSDCTPGPGWVDELAGHLADPAVGAVAPRVVAADGGSRCPLDMGPRAGLVRPGGPVAYVPTAALLARRAALADVAARGAVFDEALRHGEDVDLVWRLGAAGWRVRYEPAVRVTHAEPGTRRGRLARRYRYGTSAAPLSRRHPGALSHLALEPWSALAVGALAVRRPAVAAAALCLAVRDERRTRAAAGAGPQGAWSAVLERAGRTWRGAGIYLAQFGTPLLLAAAAGAARPGRARAACTRVAGATALLLVPALPRLPGEMAYGAGVIHGCVRERTAEPLRPVVARRGKGHSGKGNRR